MRYRGSLMVVIAGVTMAAALVTTAQEAAAPPPPPVHTVAGEENLVRAVLLLDRLAQCDGLQVQVLEQAVASGRIRVELQLKAPDDCVRSEGSLRLDVTAVPAGDYAVDVVVRDAADPGAGALARVEDARIAVPGDPNPQAEPVLTVHREGRLETWREVRQIAEPEERPEDPSRPELRGPGRPGPVRFQ